MSEINGLKLEALTNGAHAEFHYTTLERAKGHEKVSSKCTKQLTPYEGSYNEEDRVYKTSMKNLSTDDIVASDKWRGDVYRSYRTAVKAMVGITIPAMAEAAKVLMQHIKDYRINTLSQLDKLTGDLRNFIGDLKEKYVDEVAALSLTEVVNELEKANEQTASLIKLRDIQNKSREVGAVRKARTATDKAYRALMKMINALILVEGEEEYADFVAEQNSLILRYKKRVLGQTVMNDKEDEGDEPTPEVKTPEITAIYQKEGGNPDNPLEIKRDAMTVVEGKNLYLLNAAGDGPGDLILKWPDSEIDEKIKTESITLHTDTRIEFRMVSDLTEGNYSFRIETYYNGEGNPPLAEPVVVTYPQYIKLI